MLSTNEMIDEAIRIAHDAHKGFTDLDGKPVILHPMTVAGMGETSEEIICGWLHDVVEDCPHWSFEGLLEAGFSKQIVDTLRLLTKPKGVEYLEYVQTIADSGNKVAIMTKYHDLQHNLARGQAGGHTKQVEKHSKALPIIEKAIRRLKAFEDGDTIRLRLTHIYHMAARPGVYEVTVPREDFEEFCDYPEDSMARVGMAVKWANVPHMHGKVKRVTCEVL